MNADRDGVTHVVAEIKSRRAINGLELICGLLIQADDGLGPSYGINLGLQWEVFKEPLKLVAVPQKLIRAFPGDHIKKEDCTQRFRPRHANSINLLIEVKFNRIANKRSIFEFCFFIGIIREIREVAIRFRRGAYNTLSLLKKVIRSDECAKQTRK
ncbi:hypothetical protein P4H35_11135 [Paenibacillus taichungensis]|uniref:hypothetical protein n=1 Tax=Paenibacillus taichungensis TaxID=484184 RepID=UPI0011806E13|nr:hypothetical protein [Paenibacillus taichungensis]MEC0196895.1 hypothetical protein [Paenibacillus taichungensis]